jgi:hypothetical protein
MSSSGGGAANDRRDRTSDEDEIVITPGGPRRKSLVRAVKPGEVVRFDRGGISSVLPDEDLSPLTSGSTTPMSEETLVLTPGGFRPRSLVYQVEAGDALRSAGDRTLMLIPSKGAIVDVPLAAAWSPALPALGSGWIAYAFWNNGTGHHLSSFRTTWEVPSEPTTKSGQTIFLFNGIQNYGANFGILQPVLQWGASAAGGGFYWSVASWYVTSNGQAFHTGLARVNPGEALVGVMTLTGQPGTSFDYLCEFQGIAGTRLPVQNIAELLWLNETLEAYQISKCSDYPASAFTAFHAIDVQMGAGQLTLNWTPVDRVVDCKQHVVVKSNSATNGEIDIYYR